MAPAKYMVECGLILSAAGLRQTGPQFAAASVKPHPKTGMETHIGPFPSGFKATGAPLKLLIQMAWGLKEYQITAGASWIGEDRFDIEARAPEDTNFTPVQQRLMLRSLLTNRFELRLHSEKRELPAFALVLAKGGSKLVPAAGNSGEEPQLTLSSGYVKAVGVTSAGLADALSMNSDRAVVDRTGLTGKFDVTLKWNPDMGDLNGVPLVTALQEQLGLKLESPKAPVDVLVIDEAQRPSAN